MILWSQNIRKAKCGHLRRLAAKPPGGPPGRRTQVGVKSRLCAAQCKLRHDCDQILFKGIPMWRRGLRTVPFRNNEVREPAKGRIAVVVMAIPANTTELIAVHTHGPLQLAQKRDLLRQITALQHPGK